MTPRTFKSYAGLRAFLRSHRGAVHIVVEHDGWCRIPVTGQCDCRPHYRVEPLTPETLASGERAQNEWFRSALS